MLLLLKLESERDIIFGHLTTVPGPNNEVIYALEFRKNFVILTNSLYQKILISGNFRISLHNFCIFFHTHIVRN